MTFTRRHFLATGALAGAALPGLSFAQSKPPEFKLKLGNDLPVTHSVNLRLKEGRSQHALPALQRNRRNLVRGSAPL